MKKLAIWVGCFLLASCSGGTPSYSLLSEQEVFHQSPGVMSNKVDVLFVVDNSPSMANDQLNLTTNFRSFIQRFKDQNYDFRIGVTTTDTWKATVKSQPELARLKDGETEHSGVFVIDSKTPAIQEVFMINAKQGTGGSGNERAFQSFKAALSSPLNNDFRREDAFLALIIVSDEDDFSHDGPTATTDYNFPNLHSVQSYVDYLTTLTKSSSTYKRFSTSAIYTVDAACKMRKSSGRIGVRYEQLIAATDGIKGSICDASFATSLELIAGRISELSTQFYLGRMPNPSTIHVRVNDVEVSMDETNGWTYHSDTNSIRFHGSSVPAQGASIRVDFDPLTIS